MIERKKLLEKDKNDLEDINLLSSEDCQYLGDEAFLKYLVVKDEIEKVGEVLIKRVAKEYPSIEEVIAVLPNTVKKKVLRRFLIELDEEYESKASICSLYELNVNLIQSQCEVESSWYDSHIRKKSKGLFQKFPSCEK